MKNAIINQTLAGMITLTFLAGCGSVTSKKITDITATTQSKEALESFHNGLMALDQNDNQKARTYFLKAIEQDPKMAIAYLYKSSTDLTPKEFADDLARGKSNLEGTTEWEKMYYDFLATFLSSDWSKRLKTAQEIAAKFPDAPRPQVDLGSTYLNANETGNAKACFNKAIQLDPDWIGGYTAMINACLFFAPKDFGKAEECALKAVKLAPSSAGVQISLGDCYRAEDKLEQARDAYSKAIELDANSPDAYYKKGNANTFLGNLDEARQNFMEGGKYDPSATGPTPMIAYTYLYAGDPKAAMKYYLDAVANLGSSGKDPGKVNMAKSVYLQECASIATFNNDVQKLRELIPQIEPVSLQIGTDIGTQEALLTQKAANMNLEGLAAVLDGKYDEATAKAEEMKKTLEPLTDPLKLDSYEFLLGFLSMKEKKFTDAVAHFEKTNQTSVYNKYWLAEAYEASGNKEKAKSLFKEIAGFNFNGIEFALIRNDVKKKVASL
jgi:tetratricopeptide (TPR) repeat protein